MIDKHGKTGEGRKRWKFFEALHSILAYRPATCPPHIIDTSLQSARPDSDEGDKFNNSETASEDGQLSDADEASDKSKHSTEEISSGSSRYKEMQRLIELNRLYRI